MVYEGREKYDPFITLNVVKFMRFNRDLQKVCLYTQIYAHYTLNEIIRRTLLKTSLMHLKYFFIVLQLLI